MINQVKGTLEAQTRIHLKKKYLGVVPYTVVMLVTLCIKLRSYFKCVKVNSYTI